MNQFSLSVLHDHRDLVTLLRCCPWFVRGRECVITALDSCTSTADAVSQAIGQDKVRPLGQFAMVSGDDLLDDAERLFSGFDELYVLPKGVAASISPSVWTCHCTACGEGTPKEHLPLSLENMFGVIGALRYASDGLALNVISREVDDIERIRGAL